MSPKSMQRGAAKTQHFDENSIKNHGDSRETVPIPFIPASASGFLGRSVSPLSRSLRSHRLNKTPQHADSPQHESRGTLAGGRLRRSVRSKIFQSRGVASGDRQTIR